MEALAAHVEAKFEVQICRWKDCLHERDIWLLSGLLTDAARVRGSTSRGGEELPELVPNLV